MGQRVVDWHCSMHALHNASRGSDVAMRLMSSISGRALLSSLPRKMFHSLSYCLFAG